MSALDQTDLMEGPAQPDLFGEAAPAKTAYVPDQRHVRNRIEDLLGQMQGAATWPWEPVMVRLHCEKTFPYLCDLLADPDEAAGWRLRFNAEIARLNAAAD